MIPYCIAKAGVNALYEGLRLEERHAKSGVRVTTILPASINAVKNGVVTASNAAAAVVFAAFADLNWAVVALIALGSVLGGQVGAHLGRRLPNPVLRVLVVVLGCSSPSDSHSVDSRRRGALGTDCRPGCRTSTVARPAIPVPWN